MPEPTDASVSDDTTPAPQIYTLITVRKSDEHDILVAVRKGLPALQAKVPALRAKEAFCRDILDEMRALGIDASGFADDVEKLARLRGEYEAALASFAARGEADESDPARADAALVYGYLAYLMVHEDAMRAAGRSPAGVLVQRRRVSAG